MRKLIYSTGVIILVAAAVFAWSRLVLVSPQATASSMMLDRALASEANTPISPSDMMRNHKALLPIEHWEPF